MKQESCALIDLLGCSCFEKKKKAVHLNYFEDYSEGRTVEALKKWQMEKHCFEFVMVKADSMCLFS